MDKQESAPTTSGNAIVKHIFKFDDETKSNLMNLCNIPVLAIIPVAILQNISEKVFPEYDASKGTMELLAEILGQSLMTLYWIILSFIVLLQLFQHLVVPPWVTLIYLVLLLFSYSLHLCLMEKSRKNLKPLVIE